MNVAFDMDNSDDDRFHYFRKIRSALVGHGFVAYYSKVSWAAGVQTRARELRDELLRITGDFTRCPKVHIIAHSMGGLDARHMLFRYRMHGRVASLSTVSTPHLGTSFADWGLKHLGPAIGMAGRWGLDITGFRDLTRARCRAFNRKAEQFELSNGVRYRTYAGVQTEDRVFAPFRLPWRIINREEGENDGLVSLRSAIWRQEFFVRKIEADHRNEIGWWDIRDLASEHAAREFEKRIQDFYVGIAEEAVAGERDVP